MTNQQPHITLPLPQNLSSGPLPVLKPWELTLLMRFGDHRGLHRRASVLLPLFLMLFTISVWVFSPQIVPLITPWVGSAALLLAGVYLSRVVLTTGKLSLLALCHGGEPATACLEALRRSLLRALMVVAGTGLLALLFLGASLSLLQTGMPLPYAGLLWALSFGGLVLSLFIGELVMRLAEKLEPVLSLSPPSAS